MFSFRLLLLAGAFQVSGVLAQDVFPLRAGDKPATVDDVATVKEPLADPPAPTSPPAPPEPPNAKAATPPAAKEEKPTPAKAEEPAKAASPVDDPSIPEHIVAKGDSLSKIANQVYGNGGYHLILKHFNKVDPNKLKIGQVIKTPDLAWLLEKEKVVPLMKDAVDELMAGRKLFMEAEPILRAAAKDFKGGPKIELEEGTQKQLLEAQKKITSAMQKFNAPREGVKSVPGSTALQLRTVTGHLGDLAAGKPAKFANKLDMAHNHLGNALVYVVIWAQSGYK